MSRSDTNSLKSFITRQVDRIRLPYGRRSENFPRQCVFIGTTNGDTYLKDTTGNRRYWPVRVKQCQFKEFLRDRNQILAEAVVTYGLGERVDLSKEADIQAKEEQNDRMLPEDIWVEHLRKAFEKPDSGFNPLEFTMHDLFADFGPLGKFRDGRAEQMRAAECLKFLGYKSHQAKTKGVKKRVWRKGTGPVPS
jgi:putative DNA primase/helicase